MCYGCRWTSCKRTKSMSFSAIPMAEVRQRLFYWQSMDSMPVIRKSEEHRQALDAAKAEAGEAAQKKLLEERKKLEAEKKAAESEVKRKIQEEEKKMERR